MLTSRDQSIWFSTHVSAALPSVFPENSPTKRTSKSLEWSIARATRKNRSALKLVCTSWDIPVERTPDPNTQCMVVFTYIYPLNYRNVSVNRPGPLGIWVCQKTCRGCFQPVFANSKPQVLGVRFNPKNTRPPINRSVDGKPTTWKKHVPPGSLT